MWELNRPYIPYITFEGHSHTISGVFHFRFALRTNLPSRLLTAIVHLGFLGIAWSTEPNSFYSVGRDGLLVRHYVGDGLQTVCEANAVALALNCRGPLAHAIGGEPGQRVLGGKVMKRTSSATTAARGQHVSLAQRVAPSNVVETTATTTATRTPHQLLVARRHCGFSCSLLKLYFCSLDIICRSVGDSGSKFSTHSARTRIQRERGQFVLFYSAAVIPPNAVLLLDDREETVSLSGSETPPNIIPADVFTAQSQSELFVANFLLEVKFSPS